MYFQGPRGHPVVQARGNRMLETKDPMIKVRRLNGHREETHAPSKATTSRGSGSEFSRARPTWWLHRTSKGPLYRVRWIGRAWPAMDKRWLAGCDDCLPAAFGPRY